MLDANECPTVAAELLGPHVSKRCFRAFFRMSKSVQDYDFQKKRNFYLTKILMAIELLKRLIGIV